MLTTCVLFAAVAIQPAEPKPVLPAFAAEAIKPDPKDTPLRKLQKERVRERAAAIEKMMEVIKIGQWAPSYFDEYVKVRAALAANLAELMENPEDKVKCQEMRVEAMKELEKLIEALVAAGREPPQRLNLAHAARMDAEIDLLKFKETSALALPNDADGLIKASVAELTALAASLENKEPIDKIRARALKLRDVNEKLNALTISKETLAVLEAKYAKELKEATTRLFAAALNNPESFKLIQEALQK